jgi:hypothetical protein
VQGVGKKTKPAEHLVTDDTGMVRRIVGDQITPVGKIGKSRADNGGLNAGDLTPEGLDLVAAAFARTGIMPSLGMGAAGMRKSIIDRAAQLYPRTDLASNKADYEANKTALNALQKMRDSVGSFEQTASKNLTLFIDTAKGIVDSGSPLINTPLRAINRKLLGSEKLAAFDAARRVAINEVAKVTSNPTLAGQLSDEARREVESFHPENATLKQIYAVSKILKRDMANRITSLDDQIAAIKKRIGTAPNGGEAGPVEKWDFDAKGNLVKVK